MKKIHNVDEFIANASEWRGELSRLRTLVLACGLTETIKWGSPCYVSNGCNVVGIGAFKSYFGLWFFQGALLADRAGVLMNAQPGKTQAMRQWRMHSAQDIKPVLIKRYVTEAAALALSGKRVPPKRGRSLVLPPELEAVLARRTAVARAFGKLRPGQQREYAQFVGDAKRLDTKQRRIDRILPLITAGVGLNDKYRGKS